jgi:putative endonuclease
MTPRNKARASARSGQCAEDLAAAYLAAHGLTLLARNVRCKAGEIDLVCRD